MSDSVLSQVALSCDVVWNRAREAQAFVLRLQSRTGGHADAAHLARVLREALPPSRRPVVVHPDTPQLLAGLLQADDAVPGGLVADAAWLDHAEVRPALLQTRAAERPVLLRGPLQAALPADAPAGLAQRFARRLVAPELRDAVALSAQAAVTRGVRHAAAAGGPAQAIAGQWVEGIASARLAAWCLDGAGAAAVVGWPVDEALLSSAPDNGPGNGALPVDLRVVRGLLADIAQDRAPEALLERLCGDPVLAYRFLRFCNSAGLGLRSEVETVRHGLMLVGMENLRVWLQGLAPRASDDADQRPLRAQSVLCARLNALLVDAGNQAQLSEELALCGLFSELGALTRQPLAELLSQLPLPSRVREAVLHQRGPYGACLAVSLALLRRSPSVLAACEAHDMPLDEANRALLRLLAAQQSPTAP